MKLQLSTMFCFLTLTLVLLPPSTTTAQSSEYIRSSCETTRYPETCFATLSNYSTSVGSDPRRLAIVAINVALHNASYVSNYVTNISRQSDSSNTKFYAALLDCSSTFEDAVDQINNSIKEMRQLGLTGAESVRFQLSNVQTWMSAALTNEDTCVDGLDSVADDDKKEDVVEHVMGVMQVTSNALALVNRYADTVTV